MKLEMSDQELYEWVNKVATEFYELVYNDPWFKKLFRNIDQKIITSQQTDFMVEKFGGPKKYGGRLPKDAHTHIFIDEDIWDYREKLLLVALEKIGAPKEMAEWWLRIDNAFKKTILSPNGTEGLFGGFKTQELIIEPMPDYLKKKKSA